MQRLVHGVVAATLAAGTCVGALAAELRYRLQDLNALTGLEHISVQALNNRGDFTLVDSDSDRSYLWRGGRLHDLGAWGGGTLDLNERGDVVGTRLMDNGQRLPFLWRDGRFTNLAESLGASVGAAHAVNEKGQVVGDADGRAFLYDGRQARYLDIPDAINSAAVDINDRGLIVGRAEYANDDIDERAFVVRNGVHAKMGEPIELEWGGQYEAMAVNNKGSVAVRYWDYNWGELGSSLYVGGRYTDLGYDSFAVDLNERDWAAGYGVAEVDYHEYAFFALVIHDGRQDYLGNLLTPAAQARWDLMEGLTGINDRGQLLGHGDLADGRSHAFIATPVPEAPAVAMMLAGLGVVGAARWARRLPGSGRRQ